MKRMISHGGLALCALAALAACAGPNAREEVARRATTELVGLPKARLLSCAGVPERQAVVDGEEVYSYVRESPFAPPAPTTAIGAQGGSGGAGIGIGMTFPLFASSDPGGCRTDITLRNGVVTRVGYASGSNLADCASIIDNCVAPAR